VILRSGVADDAQQTNIEVATVWVIFSTVLVWYGGER